MRTLYTGVLLAICLCYLQVPSTHAASAYRLPAYTEYPDYKFTTQKTSVTLESTPEKRVILKTGPERITTFSMPSFVTWLKEETEDDPYYPSADKRRAGVDAWSICPPHMTDVDCFYAYLRVYARLRKAAEESDRVSMRNIGKRSSVAASPSESARARSRLRLMELCPDDLPPASCYLAAKLLYQRVLANIHNADSE